MPPAPRISPFDGTEKVIIDGTNLLFRLGSGAGDPAPASAIVGRIRGAVPMEIAIDLVFDGMGHGVYGRLAQKMAVRYSGRRPADDVILDLTSEYAMQHGGVSASDKVLVVTNDRGLRDLLAAKGARTAPLQWLIGKLDVPAPTSLPGQCRRRERLRFPRGNREAAAAECHRQCAAGDAGADNHDIEMPGINHCALPPPPGL